MGMRPLTTLLATAAIATAALATGVTAAAAAAPHASGQVYPVGFSCTGYGTGATLQAAQEAAREDFVGNVTVGALIYTNGQFPDGTWWAEITGDCVFVR
jgi:ABC-type sugar transport system substrate-binding protein